MCGKLLSIYYNFVLFSFTNAWLAVFILHSNVSNTNTPRHNIHVGLHRMVNEHLWSAVKATTF